MNAPRAAQIPKTLISLGQSFEERITVFFDFTVCALAVAAGGAVADGIVSGVIMAGAVVAVGGGVMVVAGGVAAAVSMKKADREVESVIILNMAL